MPRRRASLRDDGDRGGEEDGDGASCPMLRPIPNILMNCRGDIETNDPAAETSIMLSSEEWEQRWIADQIAVFRDSYPPCPGMIRRRRTSTAYYLLP